MQWDIFHSQAPTVFLGVIWAKTGNGEWSLGGLDKVPNIPFPPLGFLPNPRLAPWRVQRRKCHPSPAAISGINCLRPRIDANFSPPPGPQYIFLRTFRSSEIWTCSDLPKVMFSRKKHDKCLGESFDGLHEAVFTIGGFLLFATQLRIAWFQHELFFPIHGKLEVL